MPPDYAAWIERGSIIAVLGWVIYMLLVGKLVAGRHYDKLDKECQSLRELLPKQTSLLERILTHVERERI